MWLVRGSILGHISRLQEIYGITWKVDAKMLHVYCSEEKVLEEFLSEKLGTTTLGHTKGQLFNLPQ